MSKPANNPVIDDGRVVDGVFDSGDNGKDGDGSEVSLRPQALDEFIGQNLLRDNLRVFIEAARGRAEALDESGALLLRSEHGQVERVISGDVTLAK